MLFITQTDNKRCSYLQMLKSVGALSNLFSENASPYLVSRNVENAFCEAFDADNLGRDDCSVDASLDGIGVGIKTFLHGNGRTLQKVAEFNKDSMHYRSKSPKELITTIATLRNERIELTKRTYGLSTMIYHCVTRKPEKILIFEMTLDLIDIPRIRNIHYSNKNTIAFEDELNEYSFNITKSTLYKRFYTDNPLAEIDVKILKSPYSFLFKIFSPVTYPYVGEQISNNLSEETSKEYVILPLFSDRGSKRHVQERSGLNQWNARGRARNSNEIYIPIPIWIHQVFPHFFPKRDQSFQLRLPDKSYLSSKVCQENSKALMSNPNKSLGEWLLRKVIKIREDTLLTYNHLEILGIDSVVIKKINPQEFTIDFCSLGTYDQFESENKSG